MVRADSDVQGRQTVLSTAVGDIEEELKDLFESRLDFLKKKDSATSVSHSCVSYSPRTQAIRAQCTYKSAFPREPDFTNWNDDFIGTLDYIFASEDISLGSSRLISSSDQLRQKIEPIGHNIQTNAEDSYVASTHGPFPSEDWPSDHLLLLTTIEDIGDITFSSSAESRI